MREFVCYFKRVPEVGLVMVADVLGLVKQE